MQRITLNGVSGQLIKKTVDLPNIGLGPSTLVTGYAFVADPQSAKAKPEYKFELDGKATMHGQKVKIYNVFVADEKGAWHFDQRISVPARTPKKELEKWL